MKFNSLSMKEAKFSNTMLYAYFLSGSQSVSLSHTILVDFNNLYLRYLCVRDIENEKFNVLTLPYIFPQCLNKKKLFLENLRGNTVNQKV